MKALLMYRDRDFLEPKDLPRDERSRRFDREPPRQLPPHEQDMAQDLELKTLIRAMGRDDPFLLEIAERALLAGLQNDVDTILYRQAILRDFMNTPAMAMRLYALVVESIDERRKQHFSVLSTYPSAVLGGGIALLQMFVGTLRQLRGLADEYAGSCKSDGLIAFFAMLRSELTNGYISSIEGHLNELRFKGGVLVSAELGESNKPARFVLREMRDKRPTWLKRIFRRGPPAHTFYLAERDEAGARIFSEMEGRGINTVANAIAQSAMHVLGFFEMLRGEVAFYVACLNLSETLLGLGSATCFPLPVAAAERRHRFDQLYDVCLALSMQRSIVGNTADADYKNLIIVTGANQGGKSSFLRSIGLAQLMMQSGMFVGAASFSANLCTGVLTHYKRQEDAAMESGKLDEELRRMSRIADATASNAIVLFNESFASTNEREGSEIARQIVRALLDSRVKAFFVTHLYDFAHGFFAHNANEVHFLRAERQPDGTRTFRLAEGEPLQTSYGEDLYREVFGLEKAEMPSLVRMDGDAARISL